jgi:hypothetical protein
MPLHPAAAETPTSVLPRCAEEEDLQRAAAIRASHPMSSDVVPSALPAGPAACYEMPRVDRLKGDPDREHRRRFRRCAAA